MTTEAGGWVYIQLNGGDEVWKLTSQGSPETRLCQFSTVLAIKEPYVEAQAQNTEYQGPLYFDLDDEENVAYTLDDAKQLINKLVDLGVNTSDLGIYLSGKKGVHITVPMPVFHNGKRKWIKFLPHVYRELAYRLAVTSLDTKVYSTKRGRMWRTCNKPRSEGGPWKVQITYTELLSTETAEQYNALCKHPRVETFKPDSGTYAIDLAAQFAECLSEVTARLAHRKKPKPLTKKQLTAAWPVVKALFEGRGEGGFNAIAVQVAVYAREAGWDEAHFLTACAGLIANHQSDGSRYATSAARIRELKAQFEYHGSEAGYDFSLNACQQLLPKHAGVSAKPLIKPPTNAATPDGALAEDTEYQPGDYDAGELEESASARVGAVWEDNGKYWVSRGEDTVQVSDWCIETAIPVADPLAFEGAAQTVSVYKCKVTTVTGWVNILATAFTSGSGIQNALAGYGLSFSGTDIEARSLLPLVRKLGTGSLMTHQTPFEGLFPFKPEQQEKATLVYSSANNFVVPGKLTEGGIDFTYINMANAGGVLRPRLLEAPTLGSQNCDTSSLEFVNWFKSLISCQDASTISRFLGWFTAALYRPFFLEKYEKFPLLHVYAQAGSGKTETTRMVAMLHYFDQMPVETSPSSTSYGMESLFTSTYTIPIILDEYKPPKMNANVLEKLRGILRDSYNGREITRGGGSQSSAKPQSYASLAVTKLTAPICFIAEAPETETAILERSVMCLVKKPPPILLETRRQHYLNALSKIEWLSAIGKAMVVDLIGEELTKSLEGFQDLLTAAEREHTLSEEFLSTLRQSNTPYSASDEYRRRSRMPTRFIFNETVALFGWHKFIDTVKKHVPADMWEQLLEARVETLTGSFFNNAAQDSPLMQPEYVKVLTYMAMMSRGLNANNLLELNLDYGSAVVNGQTVLKVDPYRCYAKYRGASKSMGLETYFANADIFLRALQDSPVYMGESVGLAKDQQAQVVHLSYDELMMAGMQGWKTR